MRGGFAVEPIRGTALQLVEGVVAISHGLAAGGGPVPQRKNLGWHGGEQS